MLLIALAKLLQLIAAGNYGYFVNELYYLACSEHLDWGYVDQPPLIAVITRAARVLLGDSLVAIRFFPALAGAGKVLLAGLIAQNKHSMLFFGLGVVAGMLLTPLRRHFLNRWIWIVVLLVFVIFLPNLMWEIHHGFPTIELLEKVRNSDRNVSLSPVQFLLQPILLMHPLTLPIWMGGPGISFSRGRANPIAYWGGPTSSCSQLF